MSAFLFGALMGFVWLGLALWLAPNNQFIAFACGVAACACDLWYVGVLS